MMRSWVADNRALCSLVPPSGVASGGRGVLRRVWKLSKTGGFR
jgi:hypothetical protein